MKKMMLAGLVLLLGAAAAFAQSFKPVVAADIPPAASEVLVQRFTQMLQGGGVAVADEGTPLHIKAADVSVTTVNPNSGQVLVEVVLEARAAEVSETFNIKGVGEGEADAWLRAVKQLLPRSKAATQFVEKLK